MATERLRTIKPTGQGGDYPTPAAWEAGEQADLIALDENRVGQIEGDWSGQAALPPLSIGGWTTDATHPVTLRAVGAARHSGMWDDACVRFNGTTAHTLRSEATFVHLEGLQIAHTSVDNGSYSCIHTPNADTTLVLRCCILRSERGAFTGTCNGLNNFEGTVYADNCIIYGATHGVLSRRAAHIRNCVVADCSGYGFTSSYGGGSVTNCAFVANASDFNNDVPVNTASASGTGTNGVAVSDWTAEFVDPATRDYRLKPGSRLIDAGIDLSAAAYPFTTDIAGNTRAAPWDIGASEAQESSGAGSATPAGVAVTVGTGTATASGAGACMAAGVAIVVGVGASTAIGGANAVPTGVVVTASVGTVIASGGGAGIAQPAGVALYAAVGSVFASGAAVATAAGVTIAITVGTPSTSGAATIAPSGVSVSVDVGNPVVSAGTAGSAQPAGVAIAVRVGSPSSAGAANVSPAGVSFSVATGIPVAHGGASIVPAGVAVVVQVGTLAPPFGPHLSLVGSIRDNRMRGSIRSQRLVGTIREN